MRDEVRQLKELLHSPASSSQDTVSVKLASASLGSPADSAVIPDGVKPFASLAKELTKSSSPVFEPKPRYGIVGFNVPIDTL